MLWHFGALSSITYIYYIVFLLRFLLHIVSYLTVVVEMAKVCVVVGVGPGLGMSCVQKWASHGYKVAMVSRNAENKLASGLYSTLSFFGSLQKRNILSSAYLHSSNSVVKTEKQGLFELTQ